MRQVVENTESTERQYALRQRAIALGWLSDNVVVIDSDLGQSAAGVVDREGFQKLVTEVSMGRAGIVLGLEVSRLARNSIDWHRLLEICALTDTLILDEDGVYDPAHFNDRLLLGLKGTMSESELHLIRARLRGGLLEVRVRRATDGSTCEPGGRTHRSAASGHRKATLGRRNTRTDSARGAILRPRHWSRRQLVASQARSQSRAASRLLCLGYGCRGR
jgi:DNA invertase Pin-like site-specific DNA recombinase